MKIKLLLLFALVATASAQYVPNNSSVSISNFPASQAVTGTFWQTTQPVSIATMPTTPVTGTFWQATQPVSGTVTANAGTGTFTIKADTAANQTNALKIDGSAVTQPVSLASLPALATGANTIGSIANTSFNVGNTVALSLTSGGAAIDPRSIRALTSADNVTVANASLPVTGTFWQTTQPVSGTFWQATQPVSIATMPSTPVTGTFWQTTQPVSLATNTPDVTDRSARLLGSVTSITNALPAGTNTIGATTQVDTLGTGTISATDTLAPAPGGAGALISTAPSANSFVAMAIPGGGSQVDIQTLGTATGTYYFEQSMDSTNGSDGNWIATNFRQTGIVNTVLGYSYTVTGVFRGNSAGFKYVRVRNVGGTTPSNATTIRVTNGSGTVFQNASTPAGTNVIGKVGIDQATPGTTNLVNIGSANLVVTAVSAANTAVTATLPAVASQYHYISRIIIERVATTAIVGSAVLTYTSTNLPGSWARTTGNAAPVGQLMKDVDEVLAIELKSSAVNTATTIIAPAAGATGIVRITVYYRTGT